MWSGLPGPVIPLLQVAKDFGISESCLHRWLAQATAFDAAGADALIVDVPSDFDPAALVAALAAVTARSTIVVALPEGPARDTVAALSRGRLSDPADGWEPGHAQPSFDKQYVRDYLEQIRWNKQPPVPSLPDDVVLRTREKYVEAYRRLTGKELA